MQLRTSPVIYSFHEAFKKKFNFKEYTSPDEPTVFFGLYRKNDIRAVQEHRGLKIIWFAGVDAVKGKTLRYLRAKENAVFIAESKFIEDDLSTAGIEHESISLYMDDMYRWKPEPLGKSLYWYNAGQSRYGKQYLPAVRKAFPDLDIIIHDGNEAVPREEMDKVYAQCFANMRLLEHDGMSQSVAEAGLMGRMSIYNGNGPFSVPYEGPEGVIEAIKRLRQGYNPKLIAKRSRGYFMENEAKWADLVLRLCGTSELDHTGIFKEDHGRCGSIFRIMRRDVVDKLPKKFGDQQFERPYIDEQMIRLGLKQITTNKESGWANSEFKNTGNKGYGNFNNYITK